MTNMALDPAIPFHVVSTACSTVFLVASSIKLWKLHRHGKKGSPSWQAPLKGLIAISLLVVLLIYCTKLIDFHHATNAALSVSLLASIPATANLSLLFLQEQRRSYGVSDLATLYLLASVLCDGLYLTMPIGSVRLPTITQALLVRCSLDLAILVLDCCIRRTDLRALSKHRAPQEIYGVIDRVFFTWINPIIYNGYRRILTSEDLPPLSHDMKPGFTRDAMLLTWRNRAQPENKWTLPRALLTCLRSPFLVAAVPRIVLIAFRYAQPVLINVSIKYLKSDLGSEENEFFGYWLVVSAIVIYVGLAVTTAIYQNQINRLKLMTRSALVGVIHDATMKAPSIAHDDGEATTLMSTDADSLDDITEMIHETWAQAIEVTIGIILLASQVGWLWPLPLFLIYLCSHMSRYVAKHLQPRQKAWNSATQNRIAVTSSILGAIKSVKMIGLQDRLADRIQELRTEELSVASKLRWISVYYNASANALGIFSPAITLVIFAVIVVARGSSLDTETAFTTMAILSMITHPANMIMTIVPRVVGAFAGFERIQAFLVRPPLQSHHRLIQEGASAIQVSHLTIGRKQPFLRDVSFEIAATNFCIISGPTGSGKTTLIRAVLGEVTPSSGLIEVSTGRVAYCAQRPWLPNGTIKEVIYGATGSDAHNERNHQDWYQEVVEACCLTYDFGSLPDGDETNIGSKGVNLSGGQKQRVTLARALFARCEILLLDDTFSGLDGDTENIIFENLFGSSGLVWRMKSTVVMVSNSSQYFGIAHHVIVLGEGGILDQGKWQDIKIKAASIAKFSSDYQSAENRLLTDNFDKLEKQLRAKDETAMDLARKTGDPSLYGYYLKFTGATSIFFLIFSTMVYAFFITIPQYWLQLWTESRVQGNTFYACGFLFLAFLAWFSTSTQMWSVLIRLAPQSGSRIHGRLLYIIMNTPMSFFYRTDVGSILNRFSQDVQLVDKQLPSAVQTILTQIFKLIMQIVLLCIAEKWLAVSLPFCMLVVYLIQKVYLRTSRQLRFLELEYHAGVFSSFLESVAGLETIRSFGWSKHVVEANINSVDDSQRPEFLLFCQQRWLNMVLDLLAAAIATAVVAIAVGLRGKVSGGQLGIALNVMLVANTTLLKLVENWTTLETSLGAIARLKNLERAEPLENADGSEIELASNFPEFGHLKIANITAAYSSESTALGGVSLRVKAGQKLVICGRTGSGKSSLVLTLLRLLELRSGTIELDGVDITQLELKVLRQDCFIVVPQDALILANDTLRFNLSFNSHTSDATLITVLEKVGLWQHFSRGVITSTNELDTVINVSPPGQSQLFAVSRAIVKAAALRESEKKPILILDEATSSLDLDTESTILRIIDEEFSSRGHTVIIIAHRIGHIQTHLQSGQDALAVMADGAVVRVTEDLVPEALQRVQDME